MKSWDIFGKIHTYPNTKLHDGLEDPLNRVMEKNVKKMKKYYAMGKVTKGECGIYYSQKDVNYRIYFDKEKLPYLGFWVTKGGFRGDYNCALEPTNGYYDSIDNALSNNGLFVLKATENLTFDVIIELI